MSACALCLNIRPLLNSHYFARAFFKRQHEVVGGKLRPPYRFSRTMSFYDEKQPKAPLLCAECEHLLKFRGEYWVINCSGMRSGHFKLRDLLLTAFPDKFTEIGFVYYASMLPNLRHEELTHFGAGLFWRGSVFDWKRFDPRLNQLEIPEAAREQLREYLLGHSEFPDCCGLLVQVSSRSHLWMFYPMTARNVGVGEEAKMTTFKI